MELAKIAAFLDWVPTWLWVVIGIIAVIFIFGERILWDLEVKFPLRQGVGRG